MTDDLREIPTYTVAEAAHYLRIPVNTLRRWLLGYSNQIRTGATRSKPLITIAGTDPNLLSFHNLVEAHVLSALRKTHGISMLRVRQALDYLEEEYPSKHPLTDHWFHTDGIEIFITEYGKLESISEQGQLAMRGFLEKSLSRVERDDLKIAMRLYPFPYTSNLPATDTRLIVIDPKVSYGRPVITGSGIPTSIIAERFQAGESFEQLRVDYGRTAQEIEEAIHCEIWQQAA